MTSYIFTRLINYKYIVLIIFSIGFCSTVWAKSYTVAGDSMLPTLKSGDVVNLIVRSPKQLQRGALVAIQFSLRKRKMVKRLIALAGDKVEFVQGRLKLNEQWLDTSWWPGAKRLDLRSYKLLALQLFRSDNKIPMGSVLVMGDNNKGSFDSGDYGLLSFSHILGEIVVGVNE